MEKEGEIETPILDQESGKLVRSNFSKEDILCEFKKQFYIAGPLIIVYVLFSGIYVISVMFVGHLGELALSGASLATSFASVTGTSLMVGLSAALDTFCGQSFGAKQYNLLGIHMQRAMIVLLLVSIPLAFIWANAGNLLVFLGQDPEISAEAGLYARFMIPTLFPVALIQCLLRFLQCQNLVVPMFLSAGITTFLHIPICWFMVFKWGLGSRGVAMSMSITLWTNLLLLAAYVQFSPSCNKTWTGFSKDAFRNIPSFLKLAIPSAVMVCLEMWSFEMMVLLSGLLPNPQLETSVLAISLNMFSMINMMPQALSSSSSIRVSIELGAGRAQAARLATFVSISSILTEGILVASILILGRKLWGYSFSSEEQVVNYISQMMLLLAGSHIVDGIQCVLAGVVRGSGRQKIGALVNLGAFNFIGIPLSILLAFVLHMGGKGLWFGIIAGLSSQALFLSSLMLCTNWEDEAEKANKRVYETKSLDEVS